MKEKAKRENLEFQALMDLWDRVVQEVFQVLQVQRDLKEL